MALCASLTRLRGWLSVAAYWMGRVGHSDAGWISSPYPTVLSCGMDQDFPYGGHSQ